MTNEPSEFLLTNNEYHVLILVSHGRRNKEIARRVGIGENTVKTTLRNMMDRVKTRDRTYLTRLGFEHGFLTSGQDESLPAVPGRGLRHPVQCFNRRLCVCGAGDARGRVMRESGGKS
jgi:DNA-binding CsgD family transcriptional regulator